MSDKCIIVAKSAQETLYTGNSLASSLYGAPLTIALTGELGSGKTTFLQGLAQALGIREPLTSPTYALEQRYESDRGPFLHADLYRLTEAQAVTFVHTSDDFPGIRCIEWSQRVTNDHLTTGPAIHIRLDEKSDAHHRTIVCEFADAPLPSTEQIRQWRRDALLPDHISGHCDVVAACAQTIAEHLIAQGRIVRPTALHRAAEVHDLFRFLDFRAGGHPENNHGSDATTRWEAIRKEYPGLHHEEACAAFLRQNGYDTLAQIVEVHGLSDVPRERRTIEEKILFYADKRVMLDRIVTLEERFEDFAMRYGNGKTSEQGRKWYEETKRIEAELFPDNVPL